MSGHGFPASHRLTESREFDAVLKGCSWRAGNRALLLLARPNQQGFDRLGMIVSKKSLALAVHRNRARRLIRESFRQSLNNPHEGQPFGMDIVVLTRPGVSAEKNLSATLTRLFRRLVQESRK